MKKRNFLVLFFAHCPDSSYSLFINGERSAGKERQAMWPETADRLANEAAAIAIETWRAGESRRRIDAAQANAERALCQANLVRLSYGMAPLGPHDDCKHHCDRNMPDGHR